MRSKIARKRPPIHPILAMKKEKPPPETPAEA